MMSEDFFKKAQVRVTASFDALKESINDSSSSKALADFIRTLEVSVRHRPVRDLQLGMALVCTVGLAGTKAVFDLSADTNSGYNLEIARAVLHHIQEVIKTNAKLDILRNKSAWLFRWESTSLFHPAGVPHVNLLEGLIRFLQVDLHKRGADIFYP
jgi:hypothetical protein